MSMARKMAWFSFILGCCLLTTAAFLAWGLVGGVLAAGVSCIAVSLFAYADERDPPSDDDWFEPRK